jgi:hypothetical protein
LPITKWGADLATVTNTTKYNDNVRYLLVVMDEFSKYLFIEPLKSKRATEVLTAFQRILNQGRTPQSLQTDKGGEFNNRLFKTELQKIGIKYFTTQIENTKVATVERVVRTIRNKLHKLFQSKRSYSYLTNLNDLVQSYNLTPHRSLPNHMCPADVTKENEALVWDYMYKKKEERSTNLAKEKFRYNVGDLVRLAYNKFAFQRDYMQKWTSEVFKISDRFVRQGIPNYTVIDLLGSPIIGSFYGEEVQKVGKDENALWVVEKILRKRKHAGMEEYLVKFDGWGDRFNSWVNKADIVDIGTSETCLIT